jgi:hypothetical protein
MASRGSVDGFWTPKPIFQNKTVIIVGGGASLRGFDFNRLKGHHVIAVNAAGYDLYFANVLFFFDTRWAFENRALIEAWPGLALTASDAVSFGRVSCVDFRSGFALARGGPPLKRGRTSGHCAVVLAIALGASRVVLLGFDCKVTANRTHYHDRYCEEHAAIYANDFAPAWAGYNAEAQAVGCEIINAGPDSALTEFPFVSLDQILGDQR